MKKALEIAAQCWCDPETSHLNMNSELARAFAKRLAEKLELIEELKQLYEGKSKTNKQNIRAGDWVSFYRAVAPGVNVTNAIIARVISISDCPYVRGTKIYNTDQGPVGEKQILQSTRLED